MASERESPGFVDYVVTALSPALIMLMVGSLVFFLVEVLYAGEYSGRLLYTMFFFVFAVVLVARISIQYDARRAAIYGVALAAAVYLAILAYVEYPKGWLSSWGWLVNLGLMAVVWWSAHKLTWDCTHIDEERDSSGQGLLSAAGLSADEGKEPEDKEPKPENSEPKPEGKKKKKKKSKKAKNAQPDSRLWNWIEKYKTHREAERKRGHTPGVWVLYFALAALPLFALGQSLVASDDEDRRWNTFIQMTVYIASALGLLVTTSLLGVRRYLRQRKAKIPATMTASWLGLGGLLIVVFLVLGAFLPRPHSEVPWFGIEQAGSSKRDASKYAQRDDSEGKGEGSASRQGDSKGDKSDEKDSRNGNQKGSEPGQNGAKGEGDGKGDSGEKGSGKGKDGKGGSGEKKKGDGSDTKGDKDNSSKSSGAPKGSTQPQLGALGQIANVVKWIVFAIIALLVIFGLFFGVLKYLAPFTDWARRWLEGIRNWWASLFGKEKAKSDRKEVGETLVSAPLRPPPFHAYSNPFVDGTAEDRDAAELIAYTFEALDAWTWDRNAGRTPTETPLEFARRLGEVFPGHAEIFLRLATLYTRLAYSTLPLPDNTLAILEEAWEQMVHGTPVEA